MALHEVVKQAISSETAFRAKSVQRPSKARLAAMVAVLVPLLALAGYSWFARPEFIWGKRPPPPTIAEQDANMRMALFLLGARLDAHREDQGFYPASLEAIGEQAPGVTYELVADSIFELRGLAGRHVVVFRSDMPVDEYLGNSREIISNRGRR